MPSLSHLTRSRKPSGYVLWAGPSRINGRRILAIATVRSDNRKTGDMVQIWILPADLDPVSAYSCRYDRAVCGDCPVRSACYVNIAQAPLAVWRAYRRGRYPLLAPEDYGQVFAGRAVRIGAYGEPCAVPARVWRRVVRHAKRWTGYTHQWRRRENQPYRSYLMASAESADGAADATRRGWRYFRIVRDAEELEPRREVLCPASDEMGKRTTCKRCGLCAGANRPAKSVAIVVHGIRAGAF